MNSQKNCKYRKWFRMSRKCDVMVCRLIGREAKRMMIYKWCYYIEASKLKSKARVRVRVRIRVRVKE